MTRFILVTLALLCFPTMATIITTPAKPVIGINASEIAKRACYYQDQAYSDGAILQVGEHYMVCKAANDFETNGALKWVQLEARSAPEQQAPQGGKHYSVN
ncbi:DUF1496 domain-containing protein [Vibrio ouci]|uniref:DUF1496 domain-containing protein n=2 Tax=Vibrio ouci TaxID=2499078 RepID=A0A4Y8WKK1_9VIBR|nr:DUF1496 domain-containing protein [Vibrio ouci]